MTAASSIDHQAGQRATINTPGFGGYLLAILISAVAFDLELVVVAALSGDLWGDPAAVGGTVGPFTGLGLWAAVVLLPFVILVALPVGAAGALMVHLCCHRVSRQSVHVLAAFCSAYGVAAGLWLTGGWMALTPIELVQAFGSLLPVALAAATGRLLVIPLVRAR